MDWKAEAEAIKEDVKPFVSSMRIVESDDDGDRIHFDIETLEKIKLEVTLDSKGFSICDNGQRYNTTSTTNQQLQTGTIDKKALDGGSDFSGTSTTTTTTIYETIYALLNDKSIGYREAFAIALIDKMKSFEDRDEEDGR